MDPSIPHSPLHNLRILVVDDHEINREFLKSGLSRLARSVILAANGAEAVERCRTERFDVILLDLHMPQMDGLATATRIRDLEGPSSDARMIVLTADTRPEERTRLLDAGLDDFLNKPISIPDLARAIENVFNPNRPRHSNNDRRAESIALIDARRALSASNNDPELAAKLTDMLVRELENGLPELDCMLEQGQFAPAAARLHQWSGASGYAGAMRFSQSCRILRQRLLSGLDSSPGSCYLSFLRIAHATCDALKHPTN